MLGKETIALYVPLADGLGVWDFKWRLEDLSFKFINPKAFLAISSKYRQQKQNGILYQKGIFDY